jgi:hypothetical protein
MTADEKKRLHTNVRRGLSTALQQYSSRNFHNAMSEGGTRENLDRCMLGIQRACLCYQTALDEIDNLMKGIK